MLFILYFHISALEVFCNFLAKTKIVKINLLQLLQKSIIYNNCLFQIITLIDNIGGNL